MLNVEYFENIQKGNSVKDNTTNTLNKITRFSNFFDYQNVSNGRIDNFSQSKKTGDCYLLSSLYSISKTDAGAKILKNNIKKTSKTSYQITLPGALLAKDDYQKNNKKCFITGVYTITTSEIKKAIRSKNYSKGDLDVLLYELAFEKYRKEVIKTNKANNQRGNELNAGQFYNENYENLVLDGGWSCDANFVLTGKKSSRYYTHSSNVNTVNAQNVKEIPTVNNELSTWGVKSFLEKFKKNPKRYAITFALNLKMNNGEEGGHMLSLKRVDDNYVYFTNPWNTKKEHKMSLNEFFQSVYSFEVVDFGQSTIGESISDGLMNYIGHIADLF